MNPADLATSLLSMSAAKTQMSANIAVLKTSLDMQKSVLQLLAPTPQAPAAPGTGQHVDKTA